MVYCFNKPDVLPAVSSVVSKQRTNSRHYSCYTNSPMSRSLKWNLVNCCTTVQEITQGHSQ